MVTEGNGGFNRELEVDICLARDSATIAPSEVTIEANRRSDSR